MVIQYL